MGRSAWGGSDQTESPADHDPETGAEPDAVRFGKPDICWTHGVAGKPGKGLDADHHPRAQLHDRLEDHGEQTTVKHRLDALLGLQTLGPPIVRSRAGQAGFPPSNQYPPSSGAAVIET